MLTLKTLIDHFHVLLSHYSTRIATMKRRFNQEGGGDTSITCNLAAIEHIYRMAWIWTSRATAHASSGKLMLIPGRTGVAGLFKQTVGSRKMQRIDSCLGTPLREPLPDAIKSGVVHDGKGVGVALQDLQVARRVAEARWRV
ncbi:MAG: hypothetical protein ACE37N_13160 [Pseudohongiellaceae bacterium]